MYFTCEVEILLILFVDLVKQLLILKMDNSLVEKTTNKDILWNLADFKLFVHTLIYT